MSLNLYDYGWDEVDAIPEGGSTKLPAGGYVCLIVDTHIEKVAGVGLKIIFDVDIADGEFTKFFSKRRSQVEDWDFNGRLIRYIMKGERKISPIFKWLVNQIEKENPGFKFDGKNFDEKKFNGLLIGLVFGEQEYLDRQGNIRTATKVRFPCSIEKIRSGEIKAPPIEKLPPDKRPAPKADIPDDDVPF